MTAAVGFRSFVLASAYVTFFCFLDFRNIPVVSLLLATGIKRRCRLHTRDNTIY